MHVCNHLQKQWYVVTILEETFIKMPPNRNTHTHIAKNQFLQFPIHLKWVNAHKFGAYLILGGMGGVRSLHAATLPSPPQLCFWHSGSYSIITCYSASPIHWGEGEFIGSVDTTKVTMVKTWNKDFQWGILFNSKKTRTHTLLARNYSDLTYIRVKVCNIQIKHQWYSHWLQ